MPIIYIIRQKVSGEDPASPACEDTADECKWHMDALEVADTAGLGGIESIHQFVIH